MDPDDARSEYQGWWIYIDPDEHLVELVDLDLDLDTLCDLLRCDATDLIELNEPFLGYVDGEGEWQERQTRWYLQGADGGLSLSVRGGRTRLLLLRRPRAV